ncbi:conserved hypothetical protein [Histoplasma capsulatum H143]|uniref:Protein kinase domain-containing protein n=1 Tax=Ajellomyces capsulatus (strain H143) TaxID=544712 RepID=C6HN50_AJECH|nr:conserved hypothetical protein [Histoplasma capsulatum H143]
MSSSSVGPVRKEDSIYRDETGFDESFRIDVDFSKLELVERLKDSEASSIFHVNYCGEPRVLKVFHNNGDPGYASDHIRDLDRSRCEIRAYCRLKRFKICDAGFVPQFYGYMLAINPTSWAPHLDAFQHDTGLPCAVLMEYLPNVLLMNCVTYTKVRMEKAAIGIRKIHSALIEHNDCYPKNIVIIPGNQEKVLWIDFDVAIVYPNDAYVGERERGYMEFEAKVVESFGRKLVCYPRTYQHLLLQI